MNDDDIYKEIEQHIEANDNWIKSLTDSCNRCRNNCRKFGILWLCLHTFLTAGAVVGQFIDPCFPEAMSLILYGASVAWFMIRNTERTWDNLIQDNERAILRAIDRRESWERFLKEYRGY